MRPLPRWALAAMTTALASMAMCSQNPLMLIVDSDTGRSHCISRLPGLLGLAQDSPMATAVNFACQAWLALLPLTIALAAADFIRYRRDRLKESGLASNRATD